MKARVVLFETDIPAYDNAIELINGSQFGLEVLAASLPLLEQANTSAYLEYSLCLVLKEKLHSLYGICRSHFKHFICIDDYKNDDVIFMSCYNQKAYVREVMDSVINQTYSNWELYVVNDAPTYNTGNILEAYKDERIHYYDLKKIQYL